MSFEPRELPIEVDLAAPIAKCRFCGRTIWWGLTQNGKRNPFDVVASGTDETREVRRTSTTHWSTCRRREDALSAFAVGKKYP